VDRARLADFLRARRESLQPEDVGLPRGLRRRTGGLRREEIAALSGMSADYHSRIEQQRGPHPSEQILAAIARGLHLSLDERDHVFRLAGHAIPRRIFRDGHINPGMMRVFDRLEDTPAQVMSHLGETLRQTRLAVALLGDDSIHTGMAQSALPLVHRPGRAADLSPGRPPDA
jgi:transcriptional regulator with XRE-family HTH domain